MTLFLFQGKCAPSCTTYNSPQLSSSPEFLIDRVEVWAVGPEPIKEDEEGVTCLKHYSMHMEAFLSIPSKF